MSTQIRTTFDGISGTGGAWPAVFSLAFAAFVVITTELMPVGLLNSVATGLHVNIGTAGLVVSMPGLVAAFAAPLLTVTTSGLDRQKLLVGFMILVIAANVLIAFAPSFSLVIAGRALLGVSVGGFWSFAVSVGRQMLPARQGARATALIVGGVSVGTVVGVPVGAALGSTIGWRWAFGTVAILSAVASIVLITLLRPAAPTSPIKPRALVSLFSTPAMRVGFSVVALSSAGHFAAYTYLDPFLLQISKLSPIEKSWTFLLYGVMGVIGTYAGERLAAHDLRKTTAGVAAALGLGILLTAATGVNPRSAALCLAVWGLSFGAIPVCTQLWTYRSAPQSYEAASAVSIAVFQLALASGSFLGGRAVNLAGYRAAFCLGALLTVCCSVLLLMVKAPPAIEGLS